MSRQGCFVRDHACLLRPQPCRDEFLVLARREVNEAIDTAPNTDHTPAADVMYEQLRRVPLNCHRLVAHGKSWPSLRLAWGMKPLTSKRPEYFFRSEDDGGSWPDEEVTLTLHRPTDFENLDDDELAARMRDLVEEREEHARDDLRSRQAALPRR